MIVKLLTEHHLEFLSLKGSCRGSSESTLVKISLCWKSHAAAQFFISRINTASEPSLLAYAKSIKVLREGLTVSIE